MQQTFWGLALATALLTGCGGAGIEVTNPDQSANTNATLSFGEVKTSTTSLTTNYSATSKRFEYGVRAHLTDVGSVAGLTGQGTWIEVIDDFSTTHTGTILFPAVTRLKSSTTTSSSGSSTSRTLCTVNYQWNKTWTHGDLVASIAGGTLAAQSLSIPLSVSTLLPSTTCASSFYQGSSDLALAAQLDVEAIPSVAPLASVYKSPVILGATASVPDQWATIIGHLRNGGTSSVVDVINMSLGSDITSKTTQAELTAYLAQTPIGKTINAVIAVAAGNSGLACGQTDLNGCNAVATLLALHQDTQYSTLVVGALTGTGKAQTMADYSTRPGLLMQRFIWASGDTGFYGDTNAGQVQGTSFAAPRVAGVAALLKQKYPTLTSAQISDLILQSADRDMNNDGVPDFTGYDPLFGNGKLSLSNALKLAAQLYP